MMLPLIVATILGASDVTARVELTPPVIPFHKQAQYTITVEAPQDAGVKLPDMVEHFGGAAVYGVPEYRQHTLDDGRVRISETYTLDAVTVGLYPIAPAVITWGEQDRIEVASPVLQVRALTEEEVEAAEKFDTSIAPPVLTDPPLLNRWQFWAVALPIVVAVLAFILWWVRRPERAAAAPPPKKPWEVAYDRLRILDEKALAKSGHYEPYYVDLSSILRYYIEDRFHIHAPERTTQEFLNEVTDGNALTESQQRMLGQFLRHCDRVKFAQYQPSTKEMEESFTRVLMFVDETVPQPATAEQREAAA